MSYKAFCKNIRKEDYNLIKKMGRVVTQDIIDIYDLRSHKMKIDHDDIVFLFGHIAEKQGVNFDCIAKLTFPEVEKLSMDLGEEELRIDAWNRLLKLKEAIESGRFKDENQQNTRKKIQIITEDHLLDYTQLQQLETQLQKENIQYWEGTTKAGKTIRLTLNAEKSAADVNMTFSEFYGLTKFMEVFKVKETKIAYKPSSNR